MHDTRMKRHLAEFEAYCEGIVMGMCFMFSLVCAGQALRNTSWIWLLVALFFVVVFAWAITSKYRRLHEASHPGEWVGKDRK